MKRQGFTVKDFYTACARCDVLFDMRDMEQVSEHLHGRRYEAIHVRKKIARDRRKGIAPADPTRD